MKKIICIMVLAILFTGCVNEKKEIQTLSDTEQKLVDLAKSDLADMLQISSDDIKLIKIENITWPDSSLGYREPGVQYMPVETPGYIIELSYNNKPYGYHSDYERVILVPENKGK